MTAGIAGLVAGAVSMALGEYVSVSSQRDSERSLLAKERVELEESPSDELEELAAIYVAKGASIETARRLLRNSRRAMPSPRMPTRSWASTQTP